MIRTYVEPQIQPTQDGGFQLVVRISGSNTTDVWTSGPARLNATTYDEAVQEAIPQIRALKKGMEGEGS